MFKKVTMALFVMSFIVVSSLAATWHTANQQTVGWDPVTTSVEGNPVPADQISYEVFLMEEGDVNALPMGVTSGTTFTLTLPHEGKWFFGVKSIRTVDEEVVGESRIVWSSEPAYDFGIQYFASPSEVGGLHIPGGN